MRSFLLTLFLFLPWFAYSSEKPNIILVLIDDMGWADFSCFGNTEARTPNIDQLAAEGIAFEKFYVNSPICSPSRVAFSTGQHPARWRITSYLDNREINARRGVADWLDPAAPMLARALQRAGYATGHFGKWHMGGQRDIHEAPLITEYGFDESITNFEGLGARVLPLKYLPGKDEPIPHNLGSDTLGHGPVIWNDRATLSGKFVEAAVVFARFATSRGRPFYLNLWPDDVHAPLNPPLDRWGDGGGRHLYLQVLEELDRQLGPLFDLVKNDPKLRESTIILVCSDNGPEVGLGSAGRLRGNKATLFEAGVRSSLVAWAPGLMPESAQGTRNSESVFSAIDLAPSLLSIANIPKEPDLAYDGENLAPMLLGQSKESREAPIFFRRPPDRKHFRHYQNLPDLALRSGDWKFYCDYDGGRPMLFDLEKDEPETKNAASENPEIVRKFTAQLLEWHRSMPADNGPALTELKPVKGKARSG